MLICKYLNAKIFRYLDMRLSKNFYNLIVVSYKIIPKNLKIGEIL
jgi:hypothetical protein